MVFYGLLVKNSVAVLGAPIRRAIGGDRISPARRDARSGRIVEVRDIEGKRFNIKLKLAVQNV
jgi:hypothetical protein